jgi:predicted metal-dependent phosphoesterase TrpH
VPIVDLHSHSTASDGVLAPAEVVAAAAEAGVTTLALTDHDTLAGVGEARAATEAHGIRLITALELSVKVKPGSMHLLAYFPTDDAPLMDEHLADVRRWRIVRAQKIVATLGELGMLIDIDDVRARAGGAVGRPHIAEAMVAAGHVSDVQEAFSLWIGDGRPAARPAGGLTPPEAIALVHEAGGAAVLAHPASLALGMKKLGSFVARLAAAGLDGIEVHRADHNAEKFTRYGALARELGLVATGGSDFHRPDGHAGLGRTGDPPLPPTTPDRLLEAATRSTSSA